MVIFALTVATIWCASAWWWFRFETRAWDLEVGSGSITLHKARYARDGGFRIQQAPSARVGLDFRPGILSEWGVDVNLWLLAHANKTTEWGRWETWQLSLWPLPLLLAVPGALLLRSSCLARRREIAGSCSRCGYSRAGLAPDAACPECGRGATGSARS